MRIDLVRPRQPGLYGGGDWKKHMVRWSRRQRLDQNYWPKFARDLCACRNAENEEATLINMESEAKLTLIKVIHTS